MFIRLELLMVHSSERFIFGSGASGERPYEDSYRNAPQATVQSQAIAPK